jgi:hypothetical protein
VCYSRWTRLDIQHITVVTARRPNVWPHLMYSDLAAKRTHSRVWTSRTVRLSPNMA